MKKAQKDDKVTFEDAMSRLESIVSELEDGDVSLEKSLASFEEGMRLAKVCETKLNEASGRVEKIMRDFAGEEKRVTLTRDELPEQDDADESDGDNGDDDAF